MEILLNIVCSVALILGAYYCAKYNDASELVEE